MACIPGAAPPNPLLAQYYLLQAHIASGVKIIRFQDRMEEFGSIEEMIQASNYLYLKLASMGLLPGSGGAGGSGTGVRRQIRMYSNKGL